MPVLLNRLVIFRSPTQIFRELYDFCCIVLQFSSLYHSLINQSDQNTEKISPRVHGKMATACDPKYRLIRIIFFGPVGFDLRGVYCMTRRDDLTRRDDVISK